MTVPDPYQAEPATTGAGSSSLLRAAIWVAIGALIAAAIVCVIWVLLGEQNGIVGRAFLTILLLAAFAGVAILDAHLASRRPAWFALVSMASWIILLLIGAVLIWLPDRGFFGGYDRFFRFLLIVLIVQLAVLHVRLYVKAAQRYVTPFTQVVAIVTITLVVGLAVLLVIPLVLSDFAEFHDLYWRIVVAVAILAAVGTAIIPLVNALFAPKKPRPAAPPAGYAPQPAPVAPAWPTYVDGLTPLPVMPDGSPDWNAYYTGYPSAGAHAVGMPVEAITAAPTTPGPAYEQPPAYEQAPGAEPAAEQAPTADPNAGHGEPHTPPAPPVPPGGYEGYPPPPPLPPRP